MGQNLQTQNCLLNDPLDPVDNHQTSFHQSPLTVLHQIHPDLDLSIGLAPDFDYLEPYQLVDLFLLGVMMLSQPAPSSL